MKNTIVGDNIEACLLRKLVLNGSFIPSETLAEALGISTEEVEKLVKVISLKGYPIEAHPKLGYRLVQSDSLAEIQYSVQALKTSLSFIIHYFESCSSTQEIAAMLAESGVNEGAVVIAEEQTAGRGRLSRSWVSPHGGLWFTIVLKPEKFTHLLSLAIGTAIATALRELFGIEARLKWPNDVQVEGRKVGGILVECTSEAEKLRYALVGIGVNVNNELPSELRDVAVSIRELLGRAVPRTLLLLRILEKVDENYVKLLGGFTRDIIEDWKKLSVTLGKRVRIIASNEVYEGYAIDITSNGGLVVDLGDRLEVFYAGDVVHLR
ncbi:MAG: biotin--[acetyl-CoA-carboxylase] ligase [Thermofilaceae archaeon]